MRPQGIVFQILCGIVAAAPVCAMQAAGEGDGSPTPEQTAKAWGMIALIAMAGVIMLLLLVGLIVMRRMYRVRQRRAAREVEPAAPVDAWTESAKRVKVDAEEE